VREQNYFLTKNAEKISHLFNSFFKRWSMFVIIFETSFPASARKEGDQIPISGAGLKFFITEHFFEGGNEDVFSLLRKVGGSDHKTLRLDGLDQAGRSDRTIGGALGYVRVSARNAGTRNRCSPQEAAEDIRS
jgi:hypothetical protein